LVKIRPVVAEQSQNRTATEIIIKRRLRLQRAAPSKGVFIATQLNSAQLNSTRQREQQLTEFVSRDVINKNTTDLAVRCSTGSVEFS